MELCFFFVFFIILEKCFVFILMCAVLYYKGGKKTAFCPLYHMSTKHQVPPHVPYEKKKVTKLKTFYLNFLISPLFYISCLQQQQKKKASLHKSQRGKKKKKKSFYPFQKSNKNLNADIYFVKKVLFNLFVFRQDFLSWEGGGGGNLGSHDHILNFSYATITHRQFPSNR